MSSRLAPFILLATLLALTGCSASRSIQQTNTPPPPTSSTPLTSMKTPLGMEFLLVPAGDFSMGSPETETGRDQDERQHLVTISQGFYLQRNEITQEQWRAVMGHNPSFFLNCGDQCPVEQISWEDTQHFIARLNERDPAFNYRLPTEAEWEYAARAGSTSALPNGELPGAVGEALFHAPDLEQIGWYVGNAEMGTHPVAQKQPNEWGFYDMHGNVQEWVADWHNTYPFNAVTDPAGPEQGLTKIRRGGSWNLYARFCRSASRAWASPSLFDPFTGLRLVAYAKPLATNKAPETSPLPGSALSVTSWEIFFKLDSAALTPAMSAKLADIAGSVINTNKQLVLEGHTCDLATDVYNQKLSEQRVRSVKHFLLNQGIPDQRIHSRAFGEHQPGYPNDSRQGRELNRRVVIHLN
ncbi:SUMF1/EgtB/PvdO family nonheme iron enzyme [Trichloromonas sp.]|uniref:SUMF1/EgtB/PvdO family nonheme iron enzyme n=1 Tax=Trichloromonas sp. TaxID=3069249 RepID=UPI002A3833C1|nr:SUMF1/EgtB/PvdO family nonheme iron enzyme [Trichloromonas sp.]